MGSQQEIPFTQELLRKGIHLISLSIPVIYIFVTKTFALSILIPLALLTIALDLLSKLDNPVRVLIYGLFGKMLRPHELKKNVLNGASWVLIAAVITLFIFPKILAVTGFTVLIISDTCAAIFGRKFGKHRLFTKSWEGTLAFFLSASAVILIYGTIFNAPLSYFVAGFIAAAISAFIEAASSIIKMDDNLSIPLSVGLTMLLMNTLLASWNQPFLELIK